MVTFCYPAYLTGIFVTDASNPSLSQQRTNLQKVYDMITYFSFITSNCNQSGKIT